MLGPFLNLTAVVGPNGGGKFNHSNLKIRQIKYHRCHRLHSFTQTYFEETQASQRAYL